MSIIIGIDPGLGGAVCIMRDGVPTLYRTPTITVQHKKGKKREYDISVMSLMLAERQIYTYHTFIEKAQAMPGQGVTSMFSIGYGFGLWVGLISSKGMPYTVVHPKTWQKVMLADVDKHDTKAASIIVAKRLFPGVSLRETERCTTDSDAFSDALLIAEYGRRTIG